jgi:hypothetical protein
MGARQSIALLITKPALVLFPRKPSKTTKYWSWDEEEAPEIVARRELREATSLFLWMCLFLLVFWALFKVPIAFLWAMRILGVKSLQILIGLGVVLFGYIAFAFKAINQRLYGTVEIAFAGVAGIITARQIRFEADWSGQAAALIGAVYIVSRGLSNVKDGIAKEKKKAEEELERVRASRPVVEAYYAPAVRDTFHYIDD